MTSPRDIVPQDAACPWGAFAPPDLQHCEANLCGWITTPANAWSNLAFLVAAWWLWRRRKTALDAWFAWVAVGLGVTSFALHATFTWWGQWLDYIGMYPYVLLMLALNLRRLGAARWRSVFAGGGAVSVALLPVLRSVGIGVQWIMVALIGAVVATEGALAARAPRADYRPWLVGIAITSAGVGLWLMDYNRVWCRPDDHVVQLHAIWHALAAAAIPFVATFYGRQYERVPA